MKDEEGHDRDRCPVCKLGAGTFMAVLVVFVLLGLIGLAAVTGWFA